MAENTNSNYEQPAIPKFDGHYDHWVFLMENLLRSKEYWNIVEGGLHVLLEEPTPEQRKSHEEGKLKDLKAKNYLFASLERSIIETILDKFVQSYTGIYEAKVPRVHER